MGIYNISFWLVFFSFGTLCASSAYEFELLPDDSWGSSDEHESLPEITLPPSDFDGFIEMYKDRLIAGYKQWEERKNDRTFTGTDEEAFNAVKQEISNLIERSPNFRYYPWDVLKENLKNLLNNLKAKPFDLEQILSKTQQIYLESSLGDSISGRIFIKIKRIDNFVSVAINFDGREWILSNYIGDFLFNEDVDSALDAPLIKIKQMVARESLRNGGILASDTILQEVFDLTDNLERESTLAQNVKTTLAQEFNKKIEGMRRGLNGERTCKNENIVMDSVHEHSSPLAPAQDCGSIVITEHPIHQKFREFNKRHPESTILDMGGAVGYNSMEYVPSHRVILNDMNINELLVAYYFIRNSIYRYNSDGKLEWHPIPINNPFAVKNETLRNLVLNWLPAPQVKLPDNSVQSVFMGFIVKYMRGVDLEMVFNNAFKYLKPGGKIFLVELLPTSGWYNTFADNQIGTGDWPGEMGWHQIKPTTNAQGTRLYLRGSERDYWASAPQIYKKNNFEADFFVNRVTSEQLIRALTKAGFKAELLSDKDWMQIIATKPE